VPRYFFNIVDGYSENLVKDSEGAVFPDVDEARKEAIGLARDVARHGLHRSTILQVVVTDERGNEALTVPLSEVRAGRIRTWRDLGGHFANLESPFGTRTFLWLLAVAVLALIVLAALTTFRAGEKGGNYRTASAPASGAIVAVRFVADARAADITEFLNAYKASVVGGPRPGGFYRLSIADGTPQQDELAKIVGQMAREKIVEFAAAAP
jgi:hypothetical protein